MLSLFPFTFLDLQKFLGGKKVYSRRKTREFESGEQIPTFMILGTYFNQDETTGLWSPASASKLDKFISIFEGLHPLYALTGSHFDVNQDFLNQCRRTLKNLKNYDGDNYKAA